MADWFDSIDTEDVVDEMPDDLVIDEASIDIICREMDTPAAADYTIGVTFPFTASQFSTNFFEWDMGDAFNGIRYRTWRALEHCPEVTSHSGVFLVTNGGTKSPFTWKFKDMYSNRDVRVLREAFHDNRADNIRRDRYMDLMENPLLFNESAGANTSQTPKDELMGVFFAFNHCCTDLLSFVRMMYTIVWEAGSDAIGSVPNTYLRVSNGQEFRTININKNTLRHNHGEICFVDLYNWLIKKQPPTAFHSLNSWQIDAMSLVLGLFPGEKEILEDIMGHIGSMFASHPFTYSRVIPDDDKDRRENLVWSKDYMGSPEQEFLNRLKIPLKALRDFKFEVHSFADVKMNSEASEIEGLSWVSHELEWITKFLEVQCPDGVVSPIASQVFVPHEQTLTWDKKEKFNHYYFGCVFPLGVFEHTWADGKHDCLKIDMIAAFETTAITDPAYEKNIIVQMIKRFVDIKFLK